MRPRTAEETERLLRYAPFTTTFWTKITYFFGISNNPAAAIHNALRLSCRAEGGRRRCGASAFTTHTRSTQPAKDETGLQSFARGGCGLPAQSAESTGCHLERSGSGVERSRQAEASAIAIRTGSRRSSRRDSSAALGMTARCHLERSSSGVERSRKAGASVLAKHDKAAPANPERQKNGRCAVYCGMKM